MLRLPRQQQTCKQPLSLSLPAPTSLNRPRTTLPEAGYTDKAPSLALRSRSEKFSITLEANYLETSQSTTCQLEDLLIFSWSPFELFNAFFHRDQRLPCEHQLGYTATSIAQVAFPRARTPQISVSSVSTLCARKIVA